MKKILLLFLFTFSTFAGMEPHIVIEGQVGDFDKKNVTLYRDGGDIVVPRNSIPKDIEIKPGAHAYAVLKSDILLKQIEENQKKRTEKKPSKEEKKAKSKKQKS